MLRYVLLSVFALLLLSNLERVLAACGGSNVDQAGREEPVTDASSNDLNNVFEKTTGARVAIDKESTADGKTQQKTEDVAKLDTGPINSEVGPITTEVGNDIAQFLNQSNPKSCRRCNLAEADLSEATLTGAYLTIADLNSADLAEATLTGAYLTGAYLTFADLKSADLTGANLSEATLYLAVLSEADLAGANLSGANLAQADLTGANLRQANLNGANMFGANLTGVIGADFTGALNVPD
jgi:uncharacterized protein YjbI with pentapeptide repeats